MPGMPGLASRGLSGPGFGGCSRIHWSPDKRGSIRIHGHKRGTIEFIQHFDRGLGSVQVLFDFAIPRHKGPRFGDRATYHIGSVGLLFPMPVPSSLGAVRLTLPIANQFRVHRDLVRRLFHGRRL